MITHCCLTRPIWLPGGASTVTSIAQQSQPAQQWHPAQHLKSLVTLITSWNDNQIGILMYLQTVLKHLNQFTLYWTILSNSSWKTRESGKPCFNMELSTVVSHIPGPHCRRYAWQIHDLVHSIVSGSCLTPLRQRRPAVPNCSSLHICWMSPS